MNPDSKVRTAEDVDSIISAELLDPAIDPILYQLVGGSMLHGPCRYKDNDGPCIKEGKCSKFFPKKYREKTVLDENGFPQYRRRNDSRIFIKKGKKFDNRFVVVKQPKTVANVSRTYQCRENRSIKFHKVFV